MHISRMSNFSQQHLETTKEINLNSITSPIHSLYKFSHLRTLLYGYNFCFYKLVFFFFLFVFMYSIPLSFIDSHHFSSLCCSVYGILYFIDLSLIYNVLLISAKQQNDAIIHTYSFNILFHYGLLQDIEYTSLRYTVGACSFPSCIY